MVTPEPLPGAERAPQQPLRARLGAEVDAVWVRRPGQELSEEEEVSLAAMRRLSTILGTHFVEVVGDDLVKAVKEVVRERGSTSVFVGTPDESRRREILHGSLVSRLVRELPGVDIRVVADRALRDGDGERR
jgi:two-component system sensor histidine kinase KdpD